MNPNTDTQPFLQLVADVHSFYRKDYSDFAGSIWWNALKPFDFPAVADAISRHCINPDNGHFMPFPADIVKMLSGTTQDAALTAWAKVDRAVRSVGQYRSVAFDDALIHRVVTDMGGWVKMNSCPSEEDWPFVKNEFVNRYRGFRSRSEVPEYLPVLVGLAEAQNSQQGFQSQPPMLIGDAQAARRVMAMGTAKAPLAIEQATPQAARHALELAEARAAGKTDTPQLEAPKKEPSK